MPDNAETLQEQAIEQVVEQPIVLEEKVYRYQPTDDEGRAIGGPQVIKYHTQEELTEKLQEQNVLLIRKLRKETRNNRLGILENEIIPDDAQRFTGIVELKPRQLSDEERYEISRKLLDPATAYEATSTLLEAELGAPLKTFSEAFQGLQQDQIKLRARLEADAFVASNPDYYKCGENFEAITSWMLRYDLAPVKDNFQKAYETLKSQRILINGPAVVQEPAPVPVVEKPVVVVPPPVQPVVGISSGLNRDNSSDVGALPQSGSDVVYEVIRGGQKVILTGLQAISAMPSEEYKNRLLHDKDFAKKVDKLESEARKPRA